MHHGPQERPASATRRGAEGEPSEDFGFSHGPPDARLEDARQIGQRLRGGERLVQQKQQFAARQRGVQGFRPAAVRKGQCASRQGTIGRTYILAGGIIFHCPHAPLQYCGGVFFRCGRHASRR